LREGRAFVNVSKIYAEAVSRNATAKALDGIAETHLSHPTDSDPPLSVRLQSLQTTITSVSADALNVTPVEAAIAYVPDAEKNEQEIRDAYQLLLARSLAIVAASAPILARSRPTETGR
jgi:hypothetical protein